MVLLYIRETIDEVANYLQVLIYLSAYDTIHNRLEFEKESGACMPYLSTENMFCNDGNNVEK